MSTVSSNARLQAGVRDLIIYVDGKRLRNTYTASIEVKAEVETYDADVFMSYEKYSYVTRKTYFIEIEADNFRLAFHTDDITITDEGAALHISLNGFFEKHFGISTTTKLGRAHLAYLRTLENYRPFWDLHIMPDDELFQTDNAKLFIAGYMAARAEIVEEQRNAK